MLDLLKEHWLHTVLLLAFLFGSFAFVIYGSVRGFTILEAGLFQVLLALAGLLGSFIFGRASARASASDVIRPHARAAIRRIIGLYNGLYRLSEKIEELKTGDDDHRLVLIQSLVNEQIATGHDVMEDWRDIVPEEVEEIERRNRAK